MFWDCHYKLIVLFAGNLSCTMLKHVHQVQSRYTAGCIFTDSINTTHASVQGDFKITSARVFPLKKIYTKKPSLPFSLYCVHRNHFQLRQPEAPFFESVRAKKWGYFNRNKPFFRGEQNQYNDCLPLFLPEIYYTMQGATVSNKLLLWKSCNSSWQML